MTPARRPAQLTDAIVVGGGPAGLSAAIVLARACRSVTVIDAGRPRNRASRSMHNYPSRDGINPLAFLRLARDEARGFGVRIISGKVINARTIPQGFEVTLGRGGRLRSRKLVIATGVVDELPAIRGIAPLYGRSVHHCPYCDGWQWRGHRLAAFGLGKDAAGLALALKGWSDDVVALTGGRGILSAAVRKKLRDHGIPLHEAPITRLVANRGLLTHILFKGGRSLERDALFFNTDQFQTSRLPALLGCEVDEKGGIKVDRHERTCVRGLFVVGDALRNVQFVLTAAGAGANAAVALNKELQKEEGRVL